ncbi:MAG: hypothetical protein SOW84_07450, partial [Candidatus Faecousia sp.]|nr:hypothetical protein [Candidatus Faecousia sp.]
ASISRISRSRLTKSADKMEGAIFAIASSPFQQEFPPQKYHTFHKKARLERFASILSFRSAILHPNPNQRRKQK